jgi:hypothetical protein
VAGATTGGASTGGAVAGKAERPGGRSKRQLMDEKAGREVRVEGGMERPEQRPTSWSRGPVR